MDFTEGKIVFWTFENHLSFQVPLCLQHLGPTKYIDVDTTNPKDYNFCFLNAWSIYDIKKLVVSQSNNIERIISNDIFLLFDCVHTTIEAFDEINAEGQKQKDFYNLHLIKKYCNIEKTKILISQDEDFVKNNCLDEEDKKYSALLSEIPYYLSYTCWSNKTINHLEKNNKFTCLLGKSIRPSRAYLVSYLYYYNLDKDIIITKYPVKKYNKSSFINELINDHSKSQHTTEEFKSFILNDILKTNDVKFLDFVKQHCGKIFEPRILKSDEHEKKEDIFYARRYNHHKPRTISNLKFVVNDQQIKPELLQSYIDITTESMYNTVEFTEKTFKPILAGIPFIPVISIDFVQYFKKLGYEPYTFVDYSHCNDSDVSTQMYKIVSQISLLKNENLQLLIEDEKPIIEHNKNVMIKTQNQLGKILIDKTYGKN